MYMYTTKTFQQQILKRVPVALRSIVAKARLIRAIS